MWNYWHELSTYSRYKGNVNSIKRPGFYFMEPINQYINFQLIYFFHFYPSWARPFEACQSHPTSAPNNENDTNTPTTKVRILAEMSKNWIGSAGLRIWQDGQRSRCRRCRYKWCKPDSLILSRLQTQTVIFPDFQSINVIYPPCIKSVPQPWSFGEIDGILMIGRTHWQFGRMLTQYLIWVVLFKLLSIKPILGCKEGQSFSGDKVMTKWFYNFNLLFQSLAFDKVLSVRNCAQAVNLKLDNSNIWDCS